MTKKIKYDSLGYYTVLNSQCNSSDDEIRASYRELAKFWHPDHNPDKNALNMFQKISTAYDVLKDHKSRLRYTLLSIIYSEKDFPNMDALCILRNIRGMEDLNMRAFCLTEVTGKILGHSKVEKTYFCSQNEAADVIRKITHHNWTSGFCGLTAIFANIIAIVQNIVRINAKKDNLLLLIHNAITYDMEGKPREAAILLQEAKEYADEQEQFYINEYLKILGMYPSENLRKWNFKNLKLMQLFYPCIALFCVLILCGILYLKNEATKDKNAVKLKEVVIMQNGEKVFSDLAVARFFDIPVDVSDTKKLYHTIKEVNAMHGADREFDVLKKVAKGATVRITGYTADNSWFRVMFDNGEMGFIEARYLQQGIGNKIPLWSKIYKED